MARGCLVVLAFASLASALVGDEAAPSRRLAAVLEQPAATQSSRLPPKRAGGPVESDLLDLQSATQQAGKMVRMGLAWYRQTPPLDRMCWGGLVACAALGLAVLCERLIRLRRQKIFPSEFTARFLDRLHEGKLDGAKALDYCEMNPSPAARVALAAVRRWGRPAVDLERAVTLAHRVEAQRLRRNAGTLGRIAVVAPLLGFVGSLLATQRVLASLPESASLPSGAAVAGGSFAWGPALAAALVPLTLGVALATLALVAYDALTIRIERLAAALDRLGAETIDAIAMSLPPAPPPLLASVPGPRTVEPHGSHSSAITGAIRAPHQSPVFDRRADEAGRHHARGDHDVGF
jgi:biopolymer transport protein ExbB